MVHLTAAASRHRPAVRGAWWLGHHGTDCGSAPGGVPQLPCLVQQHTDASFTKTANLYFPLLPLQNGEYLYWQYTVQQGGSRSALTYYSNVVQAGVAR